VGVINDESNPVGSVHFGIVHHVRLERGEVRVKEKEMMEGTFVPVQELKRLADDGASNFESWSSLIIRDIDRILAV
jgi:predicted NUDIX family phosphoesterase